MVLYSMSVGVVKVWTIHGMTLLVNFSPISKRAALPTLCMPVNELFLNGFQSYADINQLLQMLKPRNLLLLATVQRIFNAPRARSFAATKPAVSTLTVPDSLNGLRADRVLLALLLVSACGCPAFYLRSFLPSELPVVCDSACAGCKLRARQRRPQL